MGFIYKIINDINDKVYVGQTSRTIEERFAEHIHAAFHGSEYAIHRAIRKYGVEHFHLELIEETDALEERERYWIRQYDSYHSGYNLTLGGEGTVHIDNQIVLDIFTQTQTETDTAMILGIDIHSVRSILKSNDIELPKQQAVNVEKNGKPVLQLTMDGKYISEYPSAKSAAKALGKIYKDGKGAAAHIFDVCRGKRKSAYGYIWKFKNEKDALEEFVAIKAVTMYSLDGAIIRNFPSAKAAAAFLGNVCAAVIQDVCRGTQKTAYGYKWRYAE